jgi:glycosyltransferase involved in cell wall biosynthesis
LGLDRIKRFSWSEITNEYINLYNELSDWSTFDISQRRFR